MITQKNRRKNSSEKLSNWNLESLTVCLSGTKRKKVACVPLQ